MCVSYLYMGLEEIILGNSVVGENQGQEWSQEDQLGYKVWGKEEELGKEFEKKYQ